MYHQCAGGTAHATTCPPGLAWNVVMNMCDWEDNVDCDINRSVRGLKIIVMTIISCTWAVGFTFRNQIGHRLAVTYY